MIGHSSKWILLLAALALVWAMLLGCQPQAQPTTQTASESSTEAHTHSEPMPAFSAATLGAGEKLRVVATTSIVADVVRNVAGDAIELTTLMPVGTDPHAYQPTPQDLAALDEAQVVLINGVELEAFLDTLVDTSGLADKMASVSYGIEFRSLAEETEEHEEGEEGHHHGDMDPHVWFDPNNILVWVQNIEDVLSTLDPANAATYHANAEAYSAQLRDLDSWISQQVAEIPEADRKLVTDHAAFGYFAARYGFEQVGAVLPGFSTEAQPSAQELAELEEAINALGVKAVFVGTTINPKLVQQVADDTHTQLVTLYTGSLSASDGPADSYLAMMRYNVAAMVAALR